MPFIHRSFNKAVINLGQKRQFMNRLLTNSHKDKFVSVKRFCFLALKALDIQNGKYHFGTW